MTSDELAVGTYPRFASAGAGRFTGTTNPYDPYAGSYMAAAAHTDNAYKRLTRTIDLTRVSAADKPTLRARLLWDTEPGYGHAVVEAHTAGADDWTTLPEAGGATREAVPTDCEAGFLVGEHPWLKHHLTVAAGGWAATGTTGAWHSLTGASDGWQQVNFDLSAYAGKKAEISPSCITDRAPAATASSSTAPSSSPAARPRRPRASRRPWGRGAWPGRPRGPGRPQGLLTQKGVVHDLRSGHHGPHRAAGFRSGADRLGGRPVGTGPEGARRARRLTAGGQRRMVPCHRRE